MGVVGLLFFLSAVVSSSWADPSSALPEDVPQSAEVVHRMLHPQEGSNRVSLKFSTLYEDRYAVGKGISLTNTYSLTEEWAFSGEASFFQNSLDSDVEKLSSQGTYVGVFSPKWIASISGHYRPLYGKFVIGESVQRFRLGLLAGLHFGQLENVQYPSSLRSSSIVGPQAGLTALFPFGSRWSADFQVLYLVHREPSSMTDEPRMLHAWIFSAGLGCRI